MVSLIACVGTEQNQKHTQDRWSSAKCPPTEICGPQSDPETLVNAWLTASENDLCSVLIKYSSPERSDILAAYCGAVENFEIEGLLISEGEAGANNGSSIKEVHIQGHLEFKLEGENHSRSKWSMLIVEIGGKWFVVDGFH